MLESNDGRSTVDGDVSESPGGPVEGLPLKDENAGFPPVKFHGRVRIPRVALVRHDITPYLNGKKAVKRKLNDDNVHKSRLSQMCVVRVAREDLESLKASLRRDRSRVEPPQSHSEDSNVPHKCKICDKSYNSERKLLTHQQSKHIVFTNKKPMKRVSFSDNVIIHELEYHKCRKCPKTFDNYQALKHHTKQKHKKRKCYICNYCKKYFVDRMLFKVHIKLHCDVCAELLQNKTKWLEHRRNVCRVVKLYKCKICSDAFYSVMDLKDHIYDHSGSCFVCDICEDQFHSKCSIPHHISSLHSVTHQELYTTRNVGNETLYLCNYCDLSSSQREVLESHVQSPSDPNNQATTGYKDHRCCDQCKENFATERDMLQHKWIHFMKKNDDSPILQSALTNSNIIKMTYNVNEDLPSHLKPKVVLEKLNLDKGSKRPLELIDLLGVEYKDCLDLKSLKKAIVNPKNKKTIISKHHCKLCGKYYSSNFCLNRHVKTKHFCFENLHCGVCEETFVWPSLLKAHRCIRLNQPEMLFDDARPEIHFDNDPNARFNMANGMDDLNIDDDYVRSVDFEIPTPVVELTEYDSFLSPNSDQPMSQVIREKDCQLQTLGYKLVMHEVPIEF